MWKIILGFLFFFQPLYSSVSGAVVQRIAMTGQYDDFYTETLIENQNYDTFFARSFKLNLDYGLEWDQWHARLSVPYDLQKTSGMEYGVTSSYSGAKNVFSSFGMGDMTISFAHFFSKEDEILVEPLLALHFIELQFIPSMSQLSTDRRSMYLKAGNSYELLVQMKSYLWNQEWELTARHKYEEPDRLLESKSGREILTFSTENRSSFHLRWLSSLGVLRHQFFIEAAGSYIWETHAAHSALKSQDALGGYAQACLGLGDKLTLNANTELQLDYFTKFFDDRYLNSGLIQMKIPKSQSHMVTLGLSYRWGS